LVELNLKQLLEAGVHFGHQTKRWNPKMSKFIFGEKNGIYIIDLEKTLKCFKTVCDFLYTVAENGEDILFVGTKKQAQMPVQESAERCSMPYVNERWLGGMLTNFSTVRKSISRLDNLEKMEKEGTYEFITKKEVLRLQKEREKLNKNLSGIRKMNRTPSAVFIIDPKKEEIAVKEANKLNIPVVALVDTNCDPDNIDYPIPANDDAIRAVKLFCQLISEVMLEGRKEFDRAAPEEDKVEEQQAPAVSTEEKTDGSVKVEEEKPASSQAAPASEKK